MERPARWCAGAPAVDLIRGPQRRCRPGPPGSAEPGWSAGHVNDRADGDMVERQKSPQPRAGGRHRLATLFPTAATLHALPPGRRRRDCKRLAEASRHHRAVATIPLARYGARRDPRKGRHNYPSATVVRWVDQVIGAASCHSWNRATLRISSQLLANWLRHGVIYSGVRRPLADGAVGRSTEH